MNISIYMNDGSAISSIEINDATSEEAMTAIKAFGFGENEEDWLYSDNQKIRYRVEDLDTRTSIGRELLELEEARDEWKQKYSIECIHNDEIKKAYDQLVKDFTVITNERDEWKRKWERCKGNVEAFEELLKERDEYKEIASDRDDLKVENDKVKELCEMLQDESKELEKRFSLVREDLFKANHQVSELIAENDKLKTALVGAKCTCATLEQDILFWKNRWESEFEEGVRVKKELKECKQKKSES